ncbi:MAG: NAD kinase [Cumulibacter sp.]
MSEREIVLVTHTGRRDIIELARGVVQRLHSAGVRVSVPQVEADELRFDGVCALPEPSPDPTHPTQQRAPELVMVLGGDGTFLRAAEYARPYRSPMVGVNLGHVGFLAETEPDMLHEVLGRLLDRDYTVQERMTLDVDVIDPNDESNIQHTWALNEASLERTHRERILEVDIRVDDHPLTSFGCDGVLCSTPTGSTAYAFSAGGPLMWPDVEAMLVVPNAAHALFARPLVVSPRSVVRMDLSTRGPSAVLAADGRRLLAVSAGHSVIVRQGAAPIRVARLNVGGFADKLVAKFHLPTAGFRDL